MQRNEKSKSEIAELNYQEIRVKTCLTVTRTSAEEKLMPLEAHEHLIYCEWDDFFSKNKWDDFLSKNKHIDPQIIEFVSILSRLCRDIKLSRQDRLDIVKNYEILPHDISERSFVDIRQLVILSHILGQTPHSKAILDSVRLLQKQDIQQATKELREAAAICSEHYRRNGIRTGNHEQKMEFAKHVLHDEHYPEHIRLQFGIELLFVDRQPKDDQAPHFTVLVELITNHWEKLNKDLLTQAMFAIIRYIPKSSEAQVIAVEKSKKILLLALGSIKNSSLDCEFFWVGTAYRDSVIGKSLEKCNSATAVLFSMRNFYDKLYRKTLHQSVPTSIALSDNLFQKLGHPALKPKYQEDAITKILAQYAEEKRDGNLMPRLVKIFLPNCDAQKFADNPRNKPGILNFLTDFSQLQEGVINSKEIKKCKPAVLVWIKKYDHDLPQDVQSRILEDFKKQQRKI